MVFFHTLHVLSLSCGFHYCHSVVNVTVAMACIKNVLCKSCVISVVTYVLCVFGIRGAEGSSCLSYIFEWTSLTLQLVHPAAIIYTMFWFHI
jgi:hypothetical protein